MFGFGSNNRMDELEATANAKAKEDRAWIASNSGDYMQRDNEKMRFANLAGKNKVGNMNSLDKVVGTTEQSSGLGGSLIDDALANHKKNQENAYRNSGLNISKNTGDTITNIVNALMK